MKRIKGDFFMNKLKFFSFLVLLGIIFTGFIFSQSFRDNSILSSMAIYENYGLKYYSENDAFIFNDQIVKHFTDGLDHGITHFNPSGEICVKVNRDSAGYILNITELAPDEYAAVENLLIEMDVKITALNERRMELTAIRERLNQNRVLLP